MLTHPTTDRLRELGLAGMARALEEQRRHAEAAVGGGRNPRKSGAHFQYRRPGEIMVAPLFGVMEERQ